MIFLFKNIREYYIFLTLIFFLFQITEYIMLKIFHNFRQTFCPYMTLNNEYQINSKNFIKIDHISFSLFI